MLRCPLEVHCAEGAPESLKEQLASVRVCEIVDLHDKPLDLHERVIAGGLNYRVLSAFAVHLEEVDGGKGQTEIIERDCADRLGVGQGVATKHVDASQCMLATGASFEESRLARRVPDGGVDQLDVGHLIAAD